MASLLAKPLKPNERVEGFSLWIWRVVFGTSVYLAAASTMAADVGTLSDNSETRKETQQLALPVLPAGTTISVKVGSCTYNRSGDCRFTGSITQNLLSPQGKVVLPAGTIITGQEESFVRLAVVAMSVTAKLPTGLETPVDISNHIDVWRSGEHLSSRHYVNRKTALFMTEHRVKGCTAIGVIVVRKTKGVREPHDRVLTGDELVLKLDQNLYTAYEH